MSADTAASIRDSKATKKSVDGGVHQSIPHDSGHKHVSGEAIYCDDVPLRETALHVAVVKSTQAHAKIVSMDAQLLEQNPDVIALITADDIAAGQGKNDWSPFAGDDPVFATEHCEYHGQPLMAVVATSHRAALMAAEAVAVEYERLPSILTAREAFAAGKFVSDPHTMQIGDSQATMQTAPRTLSGKAEVGGQEQFYLEGQIALAIPGEDQDVQIISSTQHPQETQHITARVLGLRDHQVTVQARRLGGGFGGKETNASYYAAVAALAARKTGQPCKFRLDRDDDFKITGKRHPVSADYRVGFDDDGRLLALEIEMYGDCGFSADLSRAIMDRALYHADNSYYCANSTLTAHCCYTNKVSNTAFRGFGGPQGMMIGEQIIEAIARELNLDPLLVRERNLYGRDARNVTPYHMTIEDFVADELIEELKNSAEYEQRQQAIETFNASHSWVKKGLALLPVKFGISFTTQHLNQAAALIHVYTDGSIMVNQGGTEMGQGLYVKVGQVVAEAFQVDLSQITVTTTDTSKVPNTSATAASSGSDMNGMAALDAANKIKQRLIACLSEQHGVPAENIRFANNQVIVGEQIFSFAEVAQQAYLQRVPLSATGFYKTPKIWYDRETARGRPFYYFTYGAACSEVIIDCFTGESRVIRTDLLQDVGQSLNPAIDLGQVEGAFIQGMGWLTNEELWWDDQGRLRTHAPSTYKIPTASDRPPIFNCTLWEKGRNKEATIHRSKGIGEPPFMLAMTVFFALQAAVNAARQAAGKSPISIDAPATAERILLGIQAE